MNPLTRQYIQVTGGGGVVINYIFSIIWRCYGPKRDILDYWGTILYFFNPIIYYEMIKFYRVETMDMGISQWNNGISGTNLVSVITMVLIVQDKILW